MHMADALISPAVGGACWVAAAALTAAAARRVRTGLDERIVPLMGVLGAFVFAAQMINFAIPLTGSSGHLAGGLLLAILLGPHAAFLTMASILTVQALFFADGGLLALGCNLLNLGAIPCLVAHVLLPPRKMRNETQSAISNQQLSICNPQFSSFRITLAAVLALQLGSLAVVLETSLSGRASIPVTTFAAFMQPIHLAIGLVEGLVTAAVAGFVFRARPEMLNVSRSLPPEATCSSPSRSLRPVLAAFFFAALLTAGVLAWFASTHPDGLEWSLARGGDCPKRSAWTVPAPTAPAAPVAQASMINLGTSAAGLLGSGLTLGMVALTGFALRRRK